MMFLWKFFVGGGWKWVAVIGVLSFALKFGYDVYNDYQDQIALQIAQAETIAKLEGVNAVNDATITAMGVQARENEINRQALSISLRDSESRSKTLERLLSRHDLEFLALNKPGLIERRINNATETVFRDLECITNPDCVLETDENNN